MRALELSGITKRYPKVVANGGISLAVEQGEIHALIGENGAGKSTLVSILYGFVQPDEGTIVVGGERRSFKDPTDAIAAGLGMVFQNFNLFPELTVAENVVFGAEPGRLGLVDRRAAAAEVGDLAERYGLQVPVGERVEHLPVGVLQRVEILKSLYRDARILILDEPTGVLTPQESEGLFEVMRSLRAAGKSIIFITHKLDEVMAVADRVTVLRDGRVTASLVTAETSPREISRHMTGRDVELSQRLARSAPGAPVLEVEGVTVEVDGRTAVDDVSLSVRAGEIVGIAGVAGNGQDALAAAIGGHHPLRSGRIRIAGTDVDGADNRRRRDLGFTHIPEDRHVTGSAPLGDAVLNLAVGYHRRSPLRERGLLQPKRMVEHAERLIRRFGVRIAGPAVAVGTLSGGNLQKIVVARELGHDAPLLVAEQPTRGVDIGAIESIHGELDEYRARGGAVLLVSSELSEVLNLSDRIAVMFEGRVMAVIPSAEATVPLLGLMMAGVPYETALAEEAASAAEGGTAR
ncbi:ABC transporter ATP-binding protein [Arenivirga flava]|uniref:Sugar ABC transporter ATP-binding protein n=1 Tax=Arenivirga flava TaxID=1930060 RepID=A0AA37UJ33_9MICO|nr:ABC transporter ATP-binding protein [Arenivirga flava]GMA29854.1 sugar ABC transporter ATP-binding protein [Arenivirga flava]